MKKTHGGKKDDMKHHVMKHEESKDTAKDDKTQNVEHGKTDDPAFKVKCLSQRGCTIYQIKGDGMTALQVTDKATGSKKAAQRAANFFTALLDAGYDVESVKTAKTVVANAIVTAVAEEENRPLKKEGQPKGDR